MASTIWNHLRYQSFIRSQWPSCFQSLLTSRSCQPSRASVRSPHTIRWFTDKKSSIPKRLFKQQQRGGSRPLPAQVRTARGAYHPLAQRLASRSCPTLLFKAKPPLTYIAACWVLGGFCFIYAAFNCWNIIYPLQPKHVDLWVSGAMGSICIVMAFFGSYTIYRVCLGLMSQWLPTD